MRVNGVEGWELFGLFTDALFNEQITSWPYRGGVGEYFLFVDPLQDPVVGNNGPRN